MSQNGISFRYPSIDTEFQCGVVCPCYSNYHGEKTPAKLKCIYSNFVSSIDLQLVKHVIGTIVKRHD